MMFIEQKAAKNLIITLIVIISLFFIGISIYLVKDSSYGSTCSTNLNLAIDKTDYKITGEVITNTNTVLQTINLDNKEYSYYKRYDFCVNGEVNADSLLKFIVYDVDNNAIGNGYFANGSGYQCVEVDKEFDNKNNFVGFKCDNCDINSNNFTPLISVGTDTITIINGVSSISDQRDYGIKGYLGCDYTVFNLFKYMMLTVVLFGMIFLLILGVDYIKKVAFSGW